MTPKNLLTTADMRVFEEWAMDFIGVPAIILMENAGRSVAEEIYNSYFAKKKIYEEVVVFCGTGNNGGDGLVCARHLFNKGIKIKVYIVGGVSGLTPDAELNFRILRKLGVWAMPLLSEKEITKIRISKKAVIVDALFGVGLNRELSGIYLDTIDFLNELNNPIVSIDVPSGLNINTGDDWGSCVKSTQTVTLIDHKKGFTLKKGKDLVGKLVVTDVGIIKTSKRKG